MTKFLFKSRTQDLSKNIINKLDMLLAEQRHQRHDLSVLQITLNKIINGMNLQKQVDEYFEENDKDGTGEAHLGTDPDVPLEDMAQDGNSSSS